jgi:hypothetical protein
MYSGTISKITQLSLELPLLSSQTAQIVQDKLNNVPSALLRVSYVITFADKKDEQENNSDGMQILSEFIKEWE